VRREKVKAQIFSPLSEQQTIRKKKKLQTLKPLCIMMQSSDIWKCRGCDHSNVCDVQFCGCGKCGRPREQWGLDDLLSRPFSIHQKLPNFGDAKPINKPQHRVVFSGDLRFEGVLVSQNEKFLTLKQG
jgi:hypothetical protein